MDFNVLIIGAGVVGLSVARSLVSEKNSICIIEKNTTYGMETSSRNSEVIHSGIYYPIHSLKSKLCIIGNQLIYDYCDSKKIDYEKCGKLIISSSDDDYSQLLNLKNNAEKLGINYSLLNETQINEYEPLVKAKHALYIDSTGVVDSHSLMKSFFNELCDYEITIAFKTEVVSISKVSDGYEIQIKNPDNSISKVTASIVINCAGLYSTSVASLIDTPSERNQLQFWKGSYFWVNNNKFNNIKCLVYPTPNQQLDGLGIHLTKGLDGRVKLGPDHEYLGESLDFDYSVDIQKKQLFFESCKNYLPSLEFDDLEPDFSGIRPKLQKPKKKFRDYIINNESAKGFDNYINLIGIESPGLTSSIAIGEYVKKIINW